MDRYLGGFADQILGALRIVVGLNFASHGGQKLFGLFGGMGGSGATAEALSQMWFGGVIELAGGLLVAVGLGTTWAAFLCSGMMAVAYFQFHFQFDFSKFFPIENRGERALLYCFVFLYFAARGPGAWSLSKLMEKSD